MPWSEVYARAEALAEQKFYDTLTCEVHDHSGVHDFAERVCENAGHRAADELHGEYWDIEVLDLPTIYLSTGDEVDEAVLKEVVSRHVESALAACSTDVEIDALGCPDCASIVEWEERLSYFWSAR